MPNPELFRVLVEGGEVTIRGCGDGYAADECLELVDKTVTVTGYQQRIRELLLGDGVDQGLIQLAVANQGAVSAAQESLLAVMPGSVGGLVWRTAQLSYAAAYTFGEQAAPAMAVELAAEVCRKLLYATSSAVGLVDHAYSKEVLTLAARRQPGPAGQRRRAAGPLRQPRRPGRPVYRAALGREPDRDAGARVPGSGRGSLRMYEIYSIGDAAFLYGVLQAIAALAQTDDYGDLAKIGLMLGVILVMGRAAMSGGTQFPVGPAACLPPALHGVLRPDAVGGDHRCLHRRGADRGPCPGRAWRSPARRSARSATT